MKNVLVFSLISILCGSKSFAQNDLKVSEIVAERGGVVLTLEDIDAALASVPAGDRSAVVAGNDRLQQILDAELLNKQMSKLGREMKLLESSEVQRALARAQDQQLSKITLERYIESAKKQDFAVLAKEYFLANPTEFSEPVASVVQHILVRSSGRSASEVLLRVKEVREKIDEPGSSFDLLVKEYSDDASKLENGGILSVAEPGVFVKPFEDAARALSEPGDISPPVETDFGTHILKLVRREPAKSESFDEVREQVVAKLENDYREGIRSKLFSDFRSANPVFHEDVIKVLRKRYGELPVMGGKEVEAVPTVPAVDGSK